MEKKKIDQVVCDSCGFEIVSVYMKPDGLRELTVNKVVTINVLDKERKLGFIVCPECDNEMTIDLDFFASY